MTDHWAYLWTLHSAPYFVCVVGVMKLPLAHSSCSQTHILAAARRSSESYLLSRLASHFPPFSSSRFPYRTVLHHFQYWYFTSFISYQAVPLSRPPRLFLLLC